MAKRLTVLGIESSCDETATAVVRLDEQGNAQTLSNIVLSQTADHAIYGGVVPELAARAHITHMDRLIKQAMDEAGLDFNQLDGVAATAGPGLVGGLLVGMMTAKAIAMAHDLSFLGINHLEGHALTPGLTQGLAPPYLLLLVSGGHTQIVSVEGIGQYKRYGTTIDDALGEAFDKTAKLLNLGYPGGPAVERAAQMGNADRFTFPQPLKGKPGCNFSFSGLKTAVRQKAQGLEKVTDRDVADICAGFQAAVVGSITDRLNNAMMQFRQNHVSETKPVLVVAGGVAANQHLRAGLSDICQQHNFKLIVPPINLCTDNAAMIAYVGTLRLARGDVDPLDLSVRARWPLDPDGQAVPFAGVKA
ncbi:N(6)-L-threonylcarbamoyladenine synthase [hydrothermal vent metagenome]|uniref:N(6)-L-threonylcarbamoyladenine synthase n=1 Tax=hydrothermal vent metagenome TaxID=652676 RepID=A0A3B0R394_9ZZZZ